MFPHPAPYETYMVVLWGVEPVLFLCLLPLSFTQTSCPSCVPS